MRHTFLLITHTGILTPNLQKDSHKFFKIYGIFHYHKCVVSVNKFSPLYQKTLRYSFKLVSCYAFFKRWLLLSQPPNCNDTSSSYIHLFVFMDLNLCSGLFPF